MSVATPPVVRQHGISDDLLARTTLTDVVYIDCHTLETPVATIRTARQWAHTILADVPDELRDRLASAWARIDIDLRPGDPDTVAGWRVASTAPEYVVLRADSARGFRGELVIEVGDGTVRMVTFVAMRENWTPEAWFPVVPGHLTFVRSLLERAGRRAADPVQLTAG